MLNGCPRTRASSCETSHGDRSRKAAGPRRTRPGLLLCCFRLCGYRVLQSFVTHMASVKQRALPQAVPAIRASISDFLDGLGVASTRSADIQLAVSEAVGNVVRHAYPHERGQIRCDAVASEGTIVISVCDWGEPFDGSTRDPGMGLGMPIMHALADHVALLTTTDGKVIELTFRQLGRQFAEVPLESIPR